MPRVYEAGEAEASMAVAAWRASAAEVDLGRAASISGPWSKATETPDYICSSSVLPFGYDRQWCLEAYTLLAASLIASTSALPAGNTRSVSVSRADP